jgi:IPT/TIG domain
MRRISIICITLAAAALLAVPPVAGAAKGPKPTINRVTPMRVSVGNLLTIRGAHFKARRGKNTVIFRSNSGRTAFAKPRKATSTKLVVRVPASVARLLSVANGRQRPTRLKLRVLSGQFSKFTPRRLSPVVTGLGEGDGPGGGGNVPALCETSDDHDGDLLSNSLEKKIGTDPCIADTDKDGVEDGYEYKSAADLNNDEYQEPNQSLPYPDKRPYPNALDPSDANTDYDGDSLSLAVEQRLWKFSTTPASRTLDPLSYSDGLQHSVFSYQAGQGDRRFPALAAAGYSKQGEFTTWADLAGYRQDLHVPDPANPGGYLVRDLFDSNLDGTETAAEGLHYDLDGNGWLSDEERDEDADGLINFDENTGRGQSKWWEQCYAEAPYYVTFAGTDLTNPDSDDDGVRDGADDQDHDDVPNVMELSRIAASRPVQDDREKGQNCKLAKAVKDAVAIQEPPIYWHETAYGRVNPFNPCLPVTSSRSCNRSPSFGSAWAPFDESPNWYALN